MLGFVEFFHGLVGFKVDLSDLIVMTICNAFTYKKYLCNVLVAFDRFLINEWIQIKQLNNIEKKRFI